MQEVKYAMLYEDVFIPDLGNVRKELCADPNGGKTSTAKMFLNSSETILKVTIKKYEFEVPIQGIRYFIRSKVQLTSVAKEA